MSFPKRTTDVASGSRDLLQSGERNSPRHTCASERGSDIDFTGQSRSSALDFGCFRRPVVRSGGAIHRPGAPPRRSRFPAVEWIVARACPSQGRDAFWIGDSGRNTKRCSRVCLRCAISSASRASQSRAKWRDGAEEDDVLRNRRDEGKIVLPCSPKFPRRDKSFFQGHFGAASISVRAIRWTPI
jgi:hypothetical protein